MSITRNLSSQPLHPLLLVFVYPGIHLQLSIPEAGGTVICNALGHGKHKLGPSEYIRVGQAIGKKLKCF